MFFKELNCTAEAFTIKWSETKVWECEGELVVRTHICHLAFVVNARGKFQFKTVTTFDDDDWAEFTERQMNPHYENYIQLLRIEV